MSLENIANMGRLVAQQQIKAAFSLEDYAGDTRDKLKGNAGKFEDWMPQSSRTRVNDANELAWGQTLQEPAIQAQMQKNPEFEQSLRKSIQDEPLDAIANHQRMTLDRMGVPREHNKQVHQNLSLLPAALGKFIGRGGVLGAIGSDNISQGLGHAMDPSNWTPNKRQAQYLQQRGNANFRPSTGDYRSEAQDEMRRARDFRRADVSAEE